MQLAMITIQEAIQRLKIAYPPFEGVCSSDGERSAEDDLLELAAHVVESASQGLTSELEDLFGVVEHVLDTGDRQTREALVSCLLLGLIHIAEGTGLDPGMFVPYLGLQTAERWVALMSDSRADT